MRSSLQNAVLLSMMFSVAEALLPLSGYLRRPAQYNSASIEEVRKQNMRMQAMEPLEASDDDDAPTPEPPKFDPKTMPGATPPLGFFDPVGFSDDASEGKVRFYREVELKHGRVAMLASLGFLVGEIFHPLWGGEVDVPSYIAFQETPLQPFWPAVVFIIAAPAAPSTAAPSSHRPSAAPLGAPSGFGRRRRPRAVRTTSHSAPLRDPAPCRRCPRPPPPKSPTLEPTSAESRLPLPWSAPVAWLSPLPWFPPPGAGGLLGLHLRVPGGRRAVGDQGRPRGG